MLLLIKLRPRNVNEVAYISTACGRQGTSGLHSRVSQVDGITDVVYRGHLGYIPGFRGYVRYVGYKTELLSSARNITHSISLFYFSISESFSGC